MNSNINYAYWATREIHDFDVEGFISQVADKYEQVTQEDSHFSGIVRDRDSLRQLWHKVMAMPNHGDASLYTNSNGRREPAMMEVWHKAGDFWRAKYRDGDRLLCDQNSLPLYDWMVKAIIASQTATEETSVPADSPAIAPADETPVLVDKTPEEAPVPAGSPAEAPADETPELIEETPVSAGSPAMATADEAPVPAAPLPHSSLYMSRERQNAEVELLFGSHSDTHDDSHHKHQWLKFASLTAAACVSLLVIFGVGLIIPLGLAGLTMSGLVK